MLVMVVMMRVGRNAVAVENAERTPIDFEAGRFEEGLHRCALVRATAQLVEWADLLLEFVQTSGKWSGAGEVNDDAADGQWLEKTYAILIRNLGRITKRSRLFSRL